MTNKPTKTEELTDEQLDSVAGAGTPKSGIMACTSPNGDITARKNPGDPRGIGGKKRNGVVACTSPNGD